MRVDAVAVGTQDDELAGLVGADDEAAAELSRSLVEDLGGRDETEAYDDSLRVLRKAYLNALYTEHSRKANEYAQNGQHEACLQELNEVNKIKHEMDEW